MVNKNEHESHPDYPATNRRHDRSSNPRPCVVPVLERWDATAHVIRQSPGVVRVQVMTLGRTVAPLPWDGLSEPLAIHALAAWELAEGGEQTTVAWELPAALTHTIEHGMGTRTMVESVKACGQAIDVAFTVLDENRVRIDLTEAVPVTVSIVFIGVVAN